MVMAGYFYACINDIEYCFLVRYMRNAYSIYDSSGEFFFHFDRPRTPATVNENRAIAVTNKWLF